MAEAVVANGRRTLDNWKASSDLQLATGPAESDGGVSDRRSAVNEERRTLTDIEVAARLGVSRFTVRSWRLKGSGPRFLKMGRAVRYRQEDVQEYEQQVLVNPTAR